MSKPKPKPPAPQDPSPRDAARALLSMLDEGAPGANALPEAQMRVLARDLIAQVEARRPPEKAPPPQPERRRKLFSRAAPLVPPADTEAPAPEPPPDPPPPPPDPPRARAQAASPRRAPEPPHATRGPAASDLPTTLSIPVRKPHRAAPPAILSLGQVQKLALQGIDLGEIEHPAIIALALRGRTPLEQAVALRALPRGQARAVHRALRMMEDRI